MVKPSETQGIGDGVSEPEGGGRTGGGESGGGAYKHDETEIRRGPRGRGGQTENRYYGAGDAEDEDDNPNAVTDS